MRTTRAKVANALWAAADPFADLQPQPDRVDFQGWGADHPYLTSLVDEVRPKIVVEVGVWKGASVITMAEHLRLRGIDGVVIAVDTWLGSWEHWVNAEWSSGLQFEDGYPTIFRTFTANISARGLEPFVVPVPLDSVNAAHLLQHASVTPDLVHIDGGHEFASVLCDLSLWWPLISPGGALICDDYDPSGVHWPGVREAVHRFFHAETIENRSGKCLVRKAMDGRALVSPAETVQAA